ncbi:MAG: septation protein SpoVG family protein [Candidatus Eisenbacteria bacterium]|uniref:Septation protein SpoVG family protein n=1 Tax=Eiseniibacteriota bacterium TaxID=2212470 RepID=A0A956SCF3_UNCEI|nr:septation protein SpoVG family protein [Candidatus Eisenbacteria bacterium]MCB9462228.1 septation protein SpoVG family protein [Candidatus Eisenbacteria bacterium]
MKVRKKFPQGPMVTEVGLLLTRRPPLLAYVDVTLWDTMVVHDLRILERQDGTRVLLMPRLQSTDGQWVTMAHPIREDARSEIETLVLRLYDEAARARDAARAREAARVRQLARATGHAPGRAAEDAPAPPGARPVAATDRSATPVARAATPVPHAAAPVARAPEAAEAAAESAQHSANPNSLETPALS